MKVSDNKIIINLYKSTKSNKLVWMKRSGSDEVWTSSMRITKNKSILFSVELSKSPHKTRLLVYLEKRYKDGGKLKSNLVKVRTINTFHIYYLIKRILISDNKNIIDTMYLIITNSEDDTLFHEYKTLFLKFPMVVSNHGEYKEDIVEYCKSKLGLKVDIKSIEFLKYKHIYKKNDKDYIMVNPMEIKQWQQIDDPRINLVWDDKDLVSDYMDNNSKNLLEYLIRNDLPF